MDPAGRGVLEEGPMGSSTDGSPAAQGASLETDEPASDQGQRGFFGRLLSAFSPAQITAEFSLILLKTDTNKTMIRPARIKKIS